MASTALQPPHSNEYLRTPLQFQPYQYSPLPTSSSIRLLSFVKLQDRIGAVSFDGQPLIECVLDSVDLNDEPQYKALSYTWGNWQHREPGQYDGYAPSVRLPIIVNGRLLYITRNLHEALWQFGPYGYWDVDRRFQPCDKTDLIRAAEEGQSRIVKRLIQKGADLNARDKFGKTGLHYAAENGHLSVAKILLDHGAKTDHVDETGRTPVNYCSQGLRDQCAEISDLLKSQARPRELCHAKVVPDFPLKIQLWADAICIDQTNLAERSSQVGMMARIYSSAQSALIWLGVAESNTQAIWECFAYGFTEKNELCPNNTVLPPGHAWMGGFTNEFFKRHWYTRKWVIQEMALPQEIQMYCGQHEFDWDRISSILLNHISMGQTPTLDHPVYVSSLKYFEELDSQFTTFTLAHVRSRTQTEPGQEDRLLTRQKLHPSRTDLSMLKLSLPVLLILTWRFQTADPRDRVYALLGIAAALEGRPPITPDYSASVSDLYAEVGKVFVQAPGLHKIRNNKTGGEIDFESLEGLSFVQGSSCHKHMSDPWHQSCEFATLSRQLPSWAPDFNGEMTTERIYHERFRAALNSKPVFYSSTKTSLALDACCIDCIIEAENIPIKVKLPIREPVRFFDPLSWLQMTANLDVVNSSGQNRAEVLWRTLMTDNVAKDPEYARLSFKEFLCEDFARYKTGYWKRKKYMQLLSSLYASDDSRSLPSPTEVNDFSKTYDIKTYDHKAPLKDPGSFHHTFAQVVRKRGLLRTASGSLGFGPRWTQPGDEVWLLAGARTPFILRRLPTYSGADCYRMIGEAYIHGVMYGETFARKDVQFHPIEIR